MFMRLFLYYKCLNPCWQQGLSPLVCPPPFFPSCICVLGSDLCLTLCGFLGSGSILSAAVAHLLITTLDIFPRLHSTRCCIVVLPIWQHKGPVPISSWWIFFFLCVVFCLFAVFSAPGLLAASLLALSNKLTCQSVIILCNLT